MSFLNTLFGSKSGESVVLIDVSAGSVAGAYAHYKRDKRPTILFTRRVPIELRSGEEHERAMSRALDVLGSSLINDGAPLLVRGTGSGRADTILVSVDAPWQETKVHVERFERKEPFVFTKRMVAAALEKLDTPVPGKYLADESIIGTILNGYETRRPYGRRAHRASVIVLTSLITEKVSKSIVDILRALFHTKNILSIAGSSLRYQALRTVFPHERDMLILDAVGPLISVSLVRRGLLVAVSEVTEDRAPRNVHAWVQKTRAELTELAKRYPLPRTIFLITQEQDTRELEQALNAAELKELWLSDNPPTIVPVRPNHISSFIEQSASALPDLPLLLMALYWQRRPIE